MIKKVIELILNLNFKESRRFYNMKYIPLIYLAFLTVIFMTYPNYAAHGYDVLNYGVKFLFPITGPIFFYFGIYDFENSSSMLNLHSILAVIFDILCVKIIINHPHENKRKSENKKFQKRFILLWFLFFSGILAS